MSNSYTITVLKSTVQIKPGKSGSASFTVTNKTGKAMTIRAEAVFVGQGEASWLVIDGEVIRDFSADGTQQYLVKISVPDNAVSGTYTCKLRVYSVDDPDEYFAESSVVEVIIPQGEAPEPAKKRDLMAIAAVAAIILLAVVAIWLGVENIRLGKSEDLDLDGFAQGAKWESGQLDDDESFSKVADIEWMKENEYGYAGLDRIPMEDGTVHALRMYSKGDVPEGKLGAIKGRFELHLEKGDHITFEAQIGFKEEAKKGEDTDGVTFIVWVHYQEEKGAWVKKEYSKTLKTIPADPSDFEPFDEVKLPDVGGQVDLELLVANTGAASDNDLAVWVNPRIIYRDRYLKVISVAAIVISVITILWAIPFIISRLFGIKGLITHAHKAVSR